MHPWCLLLIAFVGGRVVRGERLPIDPRAPDRSGGAPLVADGSDASDASVIARGFNAYRRHLSFEVAIVVGDITCTIVVCGADGAWKPLGAGRSMQLSAEPGAHAIAYSPFYFTLILGLGFHRANHAVQVQLQEYNTAPEGRKTSGYGWALVKYTVTGGAETEAVR